MHKIYSLLTLLLVSLNVHSQGTDFITGLVQPEDLLLDDNIMYIAVSDGWRILKVDLLASEPEPEIIINGIPSVHGLARNGNDLYFSQLNGENKISRIDLTDPNPTPELILGDFHGAHDILFYDGYLYIAQFSMDRIVRIDPSIPNPPIEFITNVINPMALEVVGDDMYIATWTEDKISKVNLTNPEPQASDVITNLLLPVGVTHRGNELYIAEAGEIIGQDRVSKINIPGPNPIRETVVSGLYNPTKGLVIYQDVLYIAENFKITSFQLPPLSTTDFNLSDIVLYPNPSSDVVKIEGLSNVISYTIYSIAGVMVGKGTVSNNDNIDIHNLSSGMYILELDERYNFKLIKN